MTVEISFDDEQDQTFSGIENGPTNQWWEGTCRFCHRPLRARYWMLMGKRLRPTTHDACAAAYEKMLKDPQKKVEGDAQVPEQFRHWDLGKFRNEQAFSEAQAFDPDSQRKTLVVMGDVGKGKSRLAWAIVRQFFELWSDSRNQARWVDYFSFVDLVSGDYDQSKLSRLKNCQFAFVDDIGCVDSFGKRRAEIQAALRFRVQSDRWSFLTVDHADFDRDLFEHIVMDRACVVVID